MVTVAPVGRDLDALRIGLQRWFRRTLPDARDTIVAPLRRATSGFSSESIFVCVRGRLCGNEQEDRLVLRLPPAGEGIFPTYDLARQARVQSALSTTPLPVPRPVAVELDESWVGAPFLLMERAPGFTLPDRPSYVAAGRLVEAPAHVQARVQDEFVRVLGELHRLPWDELGLGVLTPQAERGLSHDLDRAERYLAWAADGDPPEILQDALGWCRDRLPDLELPLSLLWGDPRLGNVVFDDRLHQVALIDWEMASIGPAELDLSWFVALHDGSARTQGADLPGFAAHDAVIDAYGRWLGRPVHDYSWFEVLSLVRADSIHLRIRRLLLAAGGSDAWLQDPTPAQHRLRQLLYRPGASSV